MSGAGVDGFDLLRHHGDLRAASGAFVHVDCDEGGAMARLRADLFVDGLRNIAE